MKDSNRLFFSSSTKFLFNGDQAIVLNRLNGQWMKIPKQCYDILMMCIEKKYSLADLLFSLADDEDRRYMQKLVELLESMECLNKTVERRIESISFAITHRCNLKCIHCIVDAEFGSKNKDYFDMETICSFLDKIIAANPRRIVLTGGEPLLRTDFINILDYLRRNFTGDITLMTNGTLISPNSVEEIVSRVDSIDISLDGADEQSCSVIRGKGVFDKVISNIKLLQNKGFSKISISMVLSENNARYTKQFFELNKSLGTKPMLRALSYDGRAKDNREILDNYVTTESVSHERKSDTPMIRGCCCTAGYNQLTIEANGDIFPCNLFVTPEFKLGNINEVQSLDEIMQINEGYFISSCMQHFEPDRFTACKDCNVNYFCWSCLYSMYKLDEAEFNERCKHNKQFLTHIWEE